MGTGELQARGRSWEKIGQQWSRSNSAAAERPSPPVGILQGEVVQAQSEGGERTCSWDGVQAAIGPGKPTGADANAPSWALAVSTSCQLCRRGHEAFQRLTHTGEPLASGWAVQLGRARGRNHALGRTPGPANDKQRRASGSGRQATAPIDPGFSVLDGMGQAFSAAGSAGAGSAASPCAWPRGPESPSPRSSARREVPGRRDAPRESRNCRPPPYTWFHTPVC